MKFSLDLLSNLKIGASISNNGCCLTVVKINHEYVYFDIVQETLFRTNFKLLSCGAKINIERALKYGDEIGGHLVSGHIISTAKIYNILILENNTTIYFKMYDILIMKYIFLKGFIAIDGVSLTVSNIDKDVFSVCLIPETLLKTNFYSKTTGDIVNIEVDYYTQIIIDQCERIFNQK